MSVNTKTVQGRRSVKLSSLEDVVNDARRIAAADEAGSLKRLGNWTAGQCLGHLAMWMIYAYDGAPSSPPWIV